MTHLLEAARCLRRDRRAVTALEYALIAALVALVLVGAVSTLWGHVDTVFLSVGSDVNA